MLMKFEDLLRTAPTLSTRAWLYLPKEGNWGPEASACALESEEVSPEQELDPNAGIPAMARERGLVQVMPVTVLQDIVGNVLIQKPTATSEDLLDAFHYYYQHDAFMNLGP